MRGENVIKSFPRKCLLSQIYRETIALSPGRISQLFNVAFLRATLKSWEIGPGDEARETKGHTYTLAN